MFDPGDWKVKAVVKLDTKTLGTLVVYRKRKLSRRELEKVVFDACPGVKILGVEWVSREMSSATEGA